MTEPSSENTEQPTARPMAGAQTEDGKVLIVGPDGMAVEVSAFGGTAACDYSDELAAYAEREPDTLIVSFAGNDLTPCMERGPAPSPQIVPSVTANSPGWICFWTASRSTSVAWMSVWAQCRFSRKRPPKAFFIAPVIVV